MNRSHADRRNVVGILVQMILVLHVAAAVQFLYRLQHQIKLLDGAYTMRLHAGVDGASWNLNAKRQRSRLHRTGMQAGRLGDDRGIRLETFDDGSESADSSAFFADDALDQHVGRWTKS